MNTNNQNTTNITHHTYRGTQNINYELILDDRKTVNMFFERGQLTIKAPQTFTLNDIELTIAKNINWLDERIMYFNNCGGIAITHKDYVGGESHSFLGKNYRLKIQRSQKDCISISSSAEKSRYIYINCKDNNNDYVKNLLEKWYRKNANKYLPEIYSECFREYQGVFKSFDTLAIPQEPKIKILHKSWGCSSSKHISLNLDLIKFPKECIEYMVAIMLCKRVHINGKKGFYKLLERIMPDYKLRKYNFNHFYNTGELTRRGY